MGKQRHLYVCRAFQHGRTIAKSGALDPLLDILRESLSRQRRDEVQVSAACGALRRIAVNDEICKEVADMDGIVILKQV